jgi:signal transduction histidine kinase
VQLIEELLDISRVEAGEVRLRREEVDMAAVLDDVVAILGGQFRERAIKLHLSVEERLPTVSADRQRIEQVAVNLIGNACKYTPRGGAVWVDLRSGGDELRVDVRDTGVGIAEDAKRHIFTPFYRADNPLRDVAGGTGLGLSIAKALIEQHGGEMWVSSEIGKGSTFSFIIPLQQTEVTAEEDPA